MLTRTITGVIGAAIMLTLFTLPFPVPLLVIAAIWLFAIYELGRAVKAKPAGIVLTAVLNLVALAVLSVAVALIRKSFADYTMQIFIAVLGSICVAQLLLSNGVICKLLANKERVFNYCWHSFVFITLPLSLVALSSRHPIFLVLLLGLASANDTGAVAAGKPFGIRHIVPRISPGKTIEGIIGGFAGIFSFVIFAHFGLAHFKVADYLRFCDLSLTQPLTWVLIILTCMWLAIVGFIGDITFSAIKRSVGIKDFGALLPGHGGLLDRMDSLLFIIPWFWLSGLLSWF